MDYILVILFTSAIFCAFLANITLNKDKSRIVTIVTIIASVGGLIFYGYGYAFVYDNKLIAVFRATIATISMYLGKNEFSSINSAPLLKIFIIELSFWIVHMMAIFVIANAVLVTIGAKAIQYIRSLLVRRGDLSIIYGVNSDSLALGKDLRKDKHVAIVYIDKKCDSGSMTTITNNLESVFLSETFAINAEEKLLKKINAFKKDRSITVYAMHEDQDENIAFAGKFKKTLIACKRISKANISLTLFANMDLFYTKNLQAKEDEPYGFGCVMTMDKAYLVSRVLVQNYPPCNFIHFDHKTGLATENFHALVLGFGKMGQAVLKNLVINGQFEGSTFKAAVFDPQNDAISGYMHSNNGPMFTKYDIECFNANAQATQFYSYLQENASSIKYIVVCTGSDKKNNEITTEIQSLLIKLNSNVAIFKCSYNGVVYQNCDMMSVEHKSLYTRDTLDIRLADKKAMVINHNYCGNNDKVNMLDEWIHTDFFSKMSCRAAADFNPSYLHMMGIDAEKATAEGGWNLSEEQVTNLAKTEHSRWCAFHYSMGFDTMTKEIFDKRVAEYQAQKALDPNTKYAIQKDLDHYMHICLIDWDELDKLSETYTQITGKPKNYKKDDIDNVVGLPKLLKAMK